MKVRRVRWKSRDRRIMCQHKTNLGMKLNKDCLSVSTHMVDDKYMCHIHAAYTILEDSVKGTEVLYK